MVTPAQSEARRRNGAKSRGPRTAAGKARSAMNATKHGLRAAAIVLPFVERPEDWTEHRAGILRSLAPVGALEAELSERAAVLLWRLRRCVRFETATLGAGQETAEADAARASLCVSREGVRAMARDILADDDADENEDLGEPEDLAALEAEAREAAELVELYAATRAARDDARVDGPAAARLVEHMLCNAEVDLEWSEDEPEPVNDCPLPGVPDAVPWAQWDGWTAGLVRAAAEALAELHNQEAAGDEDEDCGPLTGAALYDESAEAAENSARSRERRLARARRELARLRGDRCIPSERDLGRVERYELHLSRLLSVTLAELQRVRGLRAVVDGRAELDAAG